jgi:hypothetical protein
VRDIKASSLIIFTLFCTFSLLPGGAIAIIARKNVLAGWEC